MLERRGEQPASKPLEDHVHSLPSGQPVFDPPPGLFAFLRTPVGALSAAAVLLALCSLICVAFVPVPVCSPATAGLPIRPQLRSGPMIVSLGLWFLAVLCIAVGTLNWLKGRFETRYGSPPWDLVGSVVLLTCSIASAAFILNLALTINESVDSCGLLS